MDGKEACVWSRARAVVLTGVLLVVMGVVGVVSGRPAEAGEAAERTVSAELTAADWAQIYSQLPISAEEIKLAASDAQSNDRFGTVLAYDGDLVVIGAFGEAGGAGDPMWQAGAAYLFERNEGGINNWGEVAKLTADDPSFGDNFGYSVAVSSDVVAVGAPYKNGGTADPIPDAGAVYIFARDQGGPGNWGQVKKIVASNPGEEDDFGLTLSLSGDTLAVGAPGEDGGPDDPLPYAGAVYLFERNEGGTNNWGEVAKLAASDAASGDGFGSAVALGNNTLVVGAPQADGEGDPMIWAGAVYVFERNEGGANNWGEVAKLAASDPGQNDRFGSSAAIDGDTLVVGAPFKSGGPAGNPLFVAGAVYVFERNEGGPNQWGEVAKLRAGDPGEGDYFGRAVAVRGDTLIIGTPNEDGGPGDPLPLAGAIYVFARDEGGANQWGQVAKLAADESQPGDNIGSAVAASSGGLIFAGAPSEDGGPGDPLVFAGAAYVFCLDDDLEENDDFSQAMAIAPGSYPGLQVCNDDDYFSVALAAGDTLEVAAFFSHTAGNLDLALYDETQNLLAVSESQTDNEQLMYEADSAGVYFVRIYGYEGAHAGYELEVGVTAGVGGYWLYVPVVVGGM